MAQRRITGQRTRRLKETSRASHRRQMRRYPPPLEHRKGHARGARQVLRRSARSHGSLVFGTVSLLYFSYAYGQLD